MKVIVKPQLKRGKVECWRIMVGKRYYNTLFYTQKEAIQEAELWPEPDVYIYSKKGVLRAAYQVRTYTTTYRFPIRGVFPLKHYKNKNHDF